MKINKFELLYYGYRFFVSMHFFGAVLVPLFTDWAELPYFTVGLLQSFFSVSLFLLEIPTGVVADKHGRKWSMLWGSAIAVIGLLVYTSFKSIWIFALGELLLALSVAFTSGADKAWLYESLAEVGQENRMKQVNGRSYSIHMIGMLVGSLFGGYLANQFGLAAPMYLSAIPALLATTFVWFMPEPKHQLEEVETSHWEQSKESLKYLVNHEELWPLSLNLILVSTAGYFVIWLYQKILIDIGVAITWFGIFHSILIVAQIIIGFLFQQIEVVIGGVDQYLKLSALAVGASFLLVASFSNIVTVLIFLVIAGGFGLSRMEYAQEHMQGLIQSNNRATVGSAISMYRRIAITVTNIVFGLLATWSLPLALIGIGLLPFAAVYFFPIRVKKES